MTCLGGHRGKFRRDSFVSSELDRQNLEREEQKGTKLEAFRSDHNVLRSFLYDAETAPITISLSLWYEDWLIVCCTMVDYDCVRKETMAGEDINVVMLRTLMRMEQQRLGAKERVEQQGRDELLTPEKA